MSRFFVFDVVYPWMFGEPFDGLIKEPFSILPEWSSVKSDIDIAIRRVKRVYLPKLAKKTYTDIPFHATSSIRTTNDRGRQIAHLTHLEEICDIIETNLPEYSWNEELVHVVNRELTKTRELITVCRRIIRGDRGLTLSLGDAIGETEIAEDKELKELREIMDFEENTKPDLDKIHSLVSSLGGWKHCLRFLSALRKVGGLENAKNLLESNGFITNPAPPTVIRRAARLLAAPAALVMHNGSIIVESSSRMDKEEGSAQIPIERADSESGYSTDKTQEIEENEGDLDEERTGNALEERKTGVRGMEEMKKRKEDEREKTEGEMNGKSVVNKKKKSEKSEKQERENGRDMAEENKVENIVEEKIKKETSRARCRRRYRIKKREQNREEKKMKKLAEDLCVLYTNFFGLSFDWVW